MIAIVAVAFGAWVALPASASSPVLASWSEGSRAAAIATDLPRPPFDLGRFIAEDAFPAVVSDQLGVARVGVAPSAGPTMAPSALKRAEAASVQIFVRKCGGFGAGSGFAAAPGLVVTNAHVVAGSTSGADVVAPTQRVHASVVAFDPSRDLALLAAPGLELPTLPLSKTPASPGSIVVTLGHPNAASHLDVGPARVQERKFLNGPDPYGHLVQRLLYVLATDDVAPGSSGSAVVDARGEVIGVIYAGPPEGTGWALAVASDELRPLLSHPSTTPVAAGGCPTNR